MDKLTKGWVQHQRRAARQEAASRSYRCPLCNAEVQASLEEFKVHFTSTHATSAEDSCIEDAFKKCSLRCNDAAKSQDASNTVAVTRKRPVSGNPDSTDRTEDDLGRLSLADDDTMSSRRGSKKLCSPPASVTQQRGSSPPTPGRNRVRSGEREDEDFIRGSGKNPTGRQLWTADDERNAVLPQRPQTPQTKHAKLMTAFTGHRRSPQHRGQRQTGHHRAQSRRLSDVKPPLEMIREPDTRKISQDQLAAEVEGIYAGVLLLERKCMEYDSSQRDTDLTEDQYHALISLHRSLLHEHHDFLLASQHPLAGPALNILPAKYFMPARMWRHAIHSFLELLRAKLPHSLEHMITFIYIAYSMIALLYETVPTFEDTWIECLGDLGRYRMAIEDEDVRDRETWTEVSKSWYTKASDKIPTTGRLHHHLAILARPNALQQLYLYAKSLCAPIPFVSAKESVMTLFNPIFDPNSPASQNLDLVDAAFVRVHGSLFSGKHMDRLEHSMQQFLDLLDRRIGRQHGEWLESGYFIGISLSCQLLGFGNESNVLMRAIQKSNGEQSDTAMDDNSDMEPNAAFKTAVEFTVKTYKIVISRCGDNNILPCIHTILVFYWFMLDFDAGKRYLEDSFPWEQTALVLNYLLRQVEMNEARLHSREIPGPEKGLAHPLPEDYAMRGLMYTESYFPAKWFDNMAIDEAEKYFELPSTVHKRFERILWLGVSIARKGTRLQWDQYAQKFSVRAKSKDMPA